MITYLRGLWGLLGRASRRRLVAAALLLALLALIEGVALLSLSALFALMLSSDFSAQSPVVRLAERVTGIGDGARLATVLAGVTFALYVVKNIGAMLVLRANVSLGLRQEIEVVRRLMETYLSMPMSIHLKRNTAEMQRTVNASARQIFGSGFVAVMSSIADLMSVLVVAVILVVADPVLAVFAAIYFGSLAYVWQRLVRKRVRSAAAVLHAKQAAVVKRSQQSLHAVRDLKVLTREQYFADDLAQTRESMIPAARVINLSLVVQRYMLELAMVGATGVVGVISFTTSPVTEAMTSVAVFLAGGFRLLAPLNKILNGVTQAHAANPALRQIVSDLSELGPLADEQRREPATHVPIRPLIVCENVGFEYNLGQPVLEQIDIRIEPGEAVALVGGSGAGKSTLIDIVLGLQEPSAGSITIDGHPLPEVRRDWQRSIGYVPQAIALIDDTVRMNVALGIPPEAMSDDRIWACLEEAQLDRFVRDALPAGLDTVIGERGTRLSGGQRQRLGIARALYHEPRVLVLDEATSSLDNETEADLIATIDSLRGQTTTITIAHRLSTVRHADRIIFLEHGRVRAIGTFDRLVATIPEFARVAELGGLVTATEN